MLLRINVGLDLGFDMYDDDLPSAERNGEHILERIAEQTTRRSLEWLAQRGSTSGKDTNTSSTRFP